MKGQLFIFIMGIFVFNGCIQNPTDISQSGEIIFCKEEKEAKGLSIYIMDTEGKNQICILRAEKKGHLLAFLHGPQMVKK